jgi:hypothetical protein
VRETGRHRHRQRHKRQTQTPAQAQTHRHRETVRNTLTQAADLNRPTQNLARAMAAAIWTCK